MLTLSDSRTGNNTVASSIGVELGQTQCISWSQRSHGGVISGRLQHPEDVGSTFSRRIMSSGSCRRFMPEGVPSDRHRGVVCAIEPEGAG